MQWSSIRDWLRFKVVAVALISDSVLIPFINANNMTAIFTAVTLITIFSIILLIVMSE